MNSNPFRLIVGERPGDAELETIIDALALYHLAYLFVVSYGRHPRIPLSNF